MALGSQYRAPQRQSRTRDEKDGRAACLERPDKVAAGSVGRRA